MAVILIAGLIVKFIIIIS